MDADTARNYRASGTAGRAATLSAWSAARLLLQYGMPRRPLMRLLDWLRALPFLVGLWVLDRFADEFPQVRGERGAESE